MSASHDRRIQAAVLGACAPSAAMALALLALQPWPLWARLPLALAVLWPALWFAGRIRTRVSRPLHALANLLAALREGDFSFRAKESEGEDALGQVYREVNTLSELLRQQRLRALEATALLRTVMAEIDVAVFAFDQEDRLQLVNRAGEALLGHPRERLLGMSASELGLAEALEGESARLLELAFPGRTGRFELRRGTFREGGRPHQLLVVSDLTRPLREEERQAWQKLIRVLGHEINNSLAPIQSLSESLSRIIERQDEDWQADTRQGLDIIASRAQSLGSFMEAYTRLAKLPEPRLRPVAARALLERLAALEHRLSIAVEPGPEVQLQADEDQLAQALINLLRNAADAAGETGGGVRAGLRASGPWLDIWIEDQGHGLPAGGNLFVPFFTTKPGGNGIGLVFSRQIAEGHGGSLRLSNCPGGRGAVALLRLPLAAAGGAPA